MIENNKQLILLDSNDTRDHANLKKTDVRVYIEGTDICVYRGSNKVILPGAGFTARAHFDFEDGATEITPSYNHALGLDNTDPGPIPEGKVEKCYLFAMGVDGGGPAPQQRYDVDYGMWIKPEFLVPFKYRLLNNDIDESLRNTYFGRKTTDTHAIYYFKAFESKPTWHQRYIDGTPIDSTVYENGRTDKIESWAHLILKITKDDCREFFQATSDEVNARVNSIELLTCWAKEVDGQIYYQNIRPLTKLHFNTEWLIDETKGIDIEYDLYY